MTSTTLILIAGCAIFAVTTLAALWTGYMLLQQRWVTENAELTDEEDLIRPLFTSAYPEQRDDQEKVGDGVTVAGQTT